MWETAYCMQGFFIMNKSDDAVSELLKVCREMVEYIRHDILASPEKGGIISRAEEALKRAECEIQTTVTRPTSRIFFGRLGSHYDFRIKVRSVLKSGEEYYLSCCDGRGRYYTVQLHHEDVEFEIRSGLLLYFRGRVTDQRIVNDTPVTFVEVVSMVRNISPSESSFVVDTMKRGKNTSRKKSPQQKTSASD